MSACLAPARCAGKALATLALVGSLIGPARPALADDGYIVDNSDRTVSVTGVWSTTGTTPGFYGGDYAFRVAGNGSSSVRWPFPGGAAAGPPDDP
jgi:hypothetical protein